MAHGACRIINLVIGDKDFLRQAVYIFKSLKFSVVCFFFRNTLCNLYKIVFIAGTSQKINLSSGIVIYPDVIFHIKQFMVYDIFQIVRQVETVIRAAEGIESYVGVVNLGVKVQQLFGLGRVLSDGFDDIRLFQIT